MTLKKWPVWVKIFQKQVATTQDGFKNSSKLSSLFLLNAQLAPSHVAV
jgi:hypothetical protein